VKIGEFSRRGVARGRKSARAADHDVHPEAVLAPAGILEVDGDPLNVVFGTSRDLSADGQAPATLWRIAWSCSGPIARPRIAVCVGR
jgi:hypothetical protein